MELKCGGVKNDALEHSRRSSPPASTPPHFQSVPFPEVANRRRTASLRGSCRHATEYSGHRLARRQMEQGHVAALASPISASHTNTSFFINKIINQAEFGLPPALATVPVMAVIYLHS